LETKRKSMKRWLSDRFERSKSFESIRLSESTKLLGEKGKDKGETRKEGAENDEVEHSIGLRRPGFSISSMPSSVFNLTNTIIGAGVLSLPAAFGISGLLLGIFLLLLIFCLSILSVIFLVKVTKHAGGAGSSYREIAGLCFGKKGMIISDICLFLSCFGALCFYLDIISDLIVPLVTYWTGREAEVDRQRDLVLAIVSVILMPIISIRSLHHFRYSSFFSLLAVIYLMFVVVFRSTESLSDRNIDWRCTETSCLSWANFTLDLFGAIPIITFAFTCQMNIFPIFEELLHPTPKRMTGVSVWSLSIAAVSYLIVGVFGYMTFFDDVDGNILLNYEIDDPVVIAGRIGLGLAIFFSYPLIAHSCLNSIDSLFFAEKEFSWIRRIIFVVIVTMGSLAVAIFVENVALIFGLTGSTAGMMISFILPSLFILVLLPAKKSSPLKIGAILVLIFGLIFLIASTVVIIVDAVDS